MTPSRAAALSAGRRSARFAAGVWLPVLVAAVGLCAGVAAAPSRLPDASYADVPPPAHTGGFGEPSCHACHFEGPLNHQDGSLRLEGVPARFDNGEEYRLEVRLSHPELRRAGFQLSARYLDGPEGGRQAGSWTLPEPERMGTLESGGVVYVHQTEPGTWHKEAGDASWSVVWHAPAEPEGRVVFHLAGNAANADRSELGDLIYVRHDRTKPRRTR